MHCSAGSSHSRHSLLVEAGSSSPVLQLRIRVKSKVRVRLPTARCRSPGIAAQVFHSQASNRTTSITRAQAGEVQPDLWLPPTRNEGQGTGRGAVDLHDCGAVIALFSFMCPQARNAHVYTMPQI